MGKRDFITTVKSFYVGMWLVALFILYPMYLFGQTENPQKLNKAEVVGGLVTVDVEDAEIADVLKEIKNITRFKKTIG
ncbi:MAG: hypothetical protein WA126_04280 [Thermodesulfovibrionales bacterium]